MITRLSHTTIYVDDQDAALRFYTEKLGFEVRTDMKMDNGFRWTTMGLAGQPDLEIVLMEPSPARCSTRRRSTSCARSFAGAPRRRR